MAIPTLIGIPFDEKSSFKRGSAAAPAAIREAFHNPGGNSWTETLVDLAAPGIWRDAGDISVPRGDAALTAIEQGITRVYADGGLPIAFGGDHAVTYPVVRAVRQRHPQLTILHIDAHPDLYDEFDGDRYSHACPFARIMEGAFADRLVQVGIRAMTGHQRDQARRFGVQIIDMRAWYAGARPSIDGPVYMSIDLDGIDPAFTPGVSHPEPGGLNVRDAIDLIQDLRSTLVGADIVECNPQLDATGSTARVAAKLTRELIARMLTV
jgi:agmatinase